MAKKKKKAKVTFTSEDFSKTDDKISNMLSETPVIEGEQATVGEAMTADIPTTPRPEVEPEPEYVEPTQPVICAGCKSTVEVDTTKMCLICSGSLRFCPTCAKPGSCHQCGKGLK
jgi:hypothetical protein